MEEKDKINLDMPGSGDTARELFHENKDVFIEALECLYIRGNQGGRIMFAEKWPAASDRILPSRLLRYDYEGLSTDEEREERERLEQEAIEAWGDLLGVLEGLETRLVQYGSLNFEELEKVMRQIDRPLASYIFAERFVNRYFPLSPGEGQAAAVEQAVETGAVSDTGQKDAAIMAPHPVPQNISNAPGKHHHHNPPSEEMEVEVDVSVSKTIGHVDHSFDASMPHYAEGVDEADADDMSWLDTAEDDEFSGVKPILSEQEMPPEQGSKDGLTPAQEAQNPPSMGLKAYQDTHDAEGVSVHNTLTQDAADAVPAPDTLSQADPHQAHVADDTQMNKSGEAEPSARRPMGMDGVRLAAQQRVEEERQTLVSPQQADTQAKTPDNTQAYVPREKPVAASSGAAISGRLPMGLRAAQVTKPVDSQPLVQNEDIRSAVEVSADPEPKPRSSEPMSSAPDSPQAAPEEHKKPKVPSLDDLDKHMPPESGARSSGYPPIPGSDESDY